MSERDGEAENERQGRWKGYSDYDRVSNQYARVLENAIDSWAWIDSAHLEGARVHPEQAAEARGHIKSAAYRLVPEMEADEDEVELYREILDRWQGEDGLLQKFETTSLAQSSPGWMHQFMMDMRRAAWELGYLQAGRIEKSETKSEEASWTKKAFR